MVDPEYCIMETSSAANLGLPLHPAAPVILGSKELEMLRQALEHEIIALGNIIVMLVNKESSKPLKIHAEKKQTICPKVILFTSFSPVRQLFNLSY